MSMDRAKRADPDGPAGRSGDGVGHTVLRDTARFWIEPRPRGDPTCNRGPKRSRPGAGPLGLSGGKAHAWNAQS
jgi:hypothetical protein